MSTPRSQAISYLQNPPILSLDGTRTERLESRKVTKNHVWTLKVQAMISTSPPTCDAAATRPNGAGGSFFSNTGEVVANAAKRKSRVANVDGLFFLRRQLVVVSVCAVARLKATGFRGTLCVGENSILNFQDTAVARANSGGSSAAVYRPRSHQWQNAAHPDRV